MQWHTAFQRPFFLLLTASHARKKEKRKQPYFNWPSLHRKTFSKTFNA